jgi:hypothetical protein
LSIEQNNANTKVIGRPQNRVSKDLVGEFTTAIGGLGMRGFLGPHAWVSTAKRNDLDPRVRVAATNGQERHER